MKILGIVGSSRKEGVSGVHRLVTTVLENTAHEYEIVTLRGKNIGGCIACMGCVKDNIGKRPFNPIFTSLARHGIYSS